MTKNERILNEISKIRNLILQHRGPEAINHLGKLEDSVKPKARKKREPKRST